MDDDNTWHQVHLDDFPGSIHLRLGKNEHGWSMCTGLTILSPGGLGSQDLRKVRLGELTQQLIARVEGTRLAPQLPLKTRSLGKPGRPAVSPQELADFMKVYRQAVIEHPRRPVEATARLREVSRATVHRWLNMARAAGLHG